MARICMVLNNFELPFGGPELQAQKVAAGLMARGHQVFVIARGSGKAPVQERLGELNIIRLNHKGLASVELFGALYQYRNEFDCIHVHGVGRLASVAIRFGRWFQKKVFIKVTTAGHTFKKTQSKLKELFQTILPFRQQKLKLLQTADGIIAISNEIRQELLTNGFPLASIHDIPNGVDIGKYHPVDGESRNNLRIKLGLPLEQRIFIYTGKLTRRKGMDTLLTAWCNTAQAKTNALLLLLGSGHGQPDNLEGYIQSKKQEYFLEKSVVTLGDVTNVAEYLQAADVFVFPSRREGLPNSLLEAMACGLVCIASDIGGNNDLITSGKNGYLVSVEEIDHWQRQLDHAAAEVENQLKEAAAATIKTGYDLQVTVDRLEALFAQ